MNFTPHGSLGFRLAKITQEGDMIVIENISKGIIPYVNQKFLVRTLNKLAGIFSKIIRKIFRFQRNP